MSPINMLLVRDDSSSNSNLSPTLMKLFIALLVLMLCIVVLIGALFVLRKHRKSQRQQQSELPCHNSSQGSAKNNHHRLTITAAPYGRNSSSFVVNEKSAFIDQSNSPPASPVPEIRITFPEEEEVDAGKRKSGRVVVVRISDNGGVGLEPYTEENLPPYQSSDSDRFQSLDLDRMGGLREKEFR